MSRFDKQCSRAQNNPSFPFCYKKGIQRPGHGITLELPNGYRFLDAGQNRLLMEKVWRNPVNPNALGFLLPDTVGVLDRQVWGIEVSFEPTGYLSAQDAVAIDYQRLLKEMQDDIKTENQVRRAYGYGVVTAMDWAFPPYFDTNDHTLHWARLLHFSHNQHTIINYEVRLLGRHGAFCFTAIGSADQLPLIKREMRRLVKRAYFDNGDRYADFNPLTDPFDSLGPDALMAGNMFSAANLFVLLCNSWLLVLVSCLMVLFVYVMQYYHRRKPTYRKMIQVDERLN
ncbi:DUF2167 domain-containing protein [Chitinophaga nivalis]|uniref:DUF2167 domain-containing protein n=1 Tax=Chitinophaga nivalis TaxID=2991709 RepID=A0ABT3IPU4_9BACT|nr:DUF2167 domain-containing protein [Chitinophaga nivalis]MCW3464328.1 DUF2167 domain-containing protein [Chitinophaga nivalis]MCW3485981.1 DUF2167 domain-containing protein [Chitinophaga nivalis]